MTLAVKGHVECYNPHLTSRMLKQVLKGSVQIVKKQQTSTLVHAIILAAKGHVESYNL